MNNEPVAWMDKDTGRLSKVSYNGIPLYTHPAKTELPTTKDELWLMAEVLRAKVKEQQAEIMLLETELFVKDAFLKSSIPLTKAEIESGLSRVKWAELLIKQLPEEHEGRNSWLLNYEENK